MSGQERAAVLKQELGQYFELIRQHARTLTATLPDIHPIAHNGVASILDTSQRGILLLRQLPPTALRHDTLRTLLMDLSNLLTVTIAHLTMVLEASAAKPVDRTTEVMYAREAAECGADLARQVYLLLRTRHILQSEP